jgi:hypothetical protein
LNQTSRRLIRKGGPPLPYCKASLREIAAAAGAAWLVALVQPADIA